MVFQRRVDALRNLKTRVGDPLATAAGAAPRGVETAGSAAGERKAAGEAAGRVDAQAATVAPHATFDVAQVLFEEGGRDVELAPELFEAQLLAREEIDDPLARRLQTQ
jgi:hypothetical protein